MCLLPRALETALGYRFGSALVLVGVIAMTVFLLTLSIEQENVLMLLLGAAASALGLYLHRRNAPPSRKTERFKALRRLLGWVKKEKG